MIAVNLIPAGRLAVRRLRRRALLWGLGLGVYALAIGGAWSIVAATGGDDAVKRIHSEIELAHAARQRATAALDGVSRQLAKAAVARQFTAEVADRPDWTALFEVLGASLGSDTVLRDVQLLPAQEVNSAVANSGSSSGGVDRPRAAGLTPTLPGTPSSYKLSLRGVGRSQTAVSGFVASLEKARLFDHVKLLRTSREAFLSDTAVSFEVECALDGQGRN